MPRILKHSTLLVLAIMLAAMAPAAAQDAEQATLRINPIHPVMRPGLLHRFEIYLPPNAELDPSAEARLVCSVGVDDRLLLRRDLGIVTAHDLRQGISVNWVVPEVYKPGPMRITASWLKDSPPLKAERAILDVLSLGQDLSALAERVDALGVKQTDALPHLWLEQAALELQAPGDLLAADLIADKRARVANWLNGHQHESASGEFAYRCAIDGSVQPYRWQRSQNTEKHGVVLVLGSGLGPRPESALSKSRWPATDDKVLSALSAAGLHVLQVYPAGDGNWEGVALRRIAQVIADARRRKLLNDDLPWFGLGIENGAGGLLRFALNNPHQFTALVLHNGRVDASQVKAEPDDQAAATWHAQQRQLSLRGAHLAHLNIALSGSLVDELRWLRAYNPEYISNVEKNSAAWWLGFIEKTDEYPVILPEYVVLQPGPIGPFMVHALSDGAAPGRILLNADGDAVDLQNIAAISLAREA